MGRFVIRRTVQGVVVVFCVTVIVFVITRVVGDPVKFILPLEATPAERAARAHELGFDRSILDQFGSYLGDLVRFDFGDSLWQRGRPTMDIIQQVMPKTFLLVGAGMFLAIVVAIPLGVLASTRPGTTADRLLVTTSLLGLSVPQFWLGLVLLIVFGVHLGWLPTAGSDSLRHLVLPAITLGLPAAGRLAMMVRSSMIDELNTQYVQAPRRPRGCRRGGRSACTRCATRSIPVRHPRSAGSSSEPSPATRSSSKRLQLAGDRPDDDPGHPAPGPLPASRRSCSSSP